MPTYSREARPDKTFSASFDARWLDLYSLLGAMPDADTTTLRDRMRVAYTEATANLDHRNFERRIHFQTMAERIIPHSRRILLDPALRERYDQEHALHQSHHPAAREFTAFLNSLSMPGFGGGGEINSDGVRQAVLGQHLELAQEPYAEAGPGDGQTMSPAATPVQTAPIACAALPATLQHAFALLPESDAATRPPVETAASNSTVAAKQPTLVPAEANASVRASQVAQVVEAEGQFFASVLRPDGPSASPHSTATFIHARPKSAPRAPRARGFSRVSLGEDELSRRAAGNLSSRGKRVVGHTTQLLATGVCAALLTLSIMQSDDEAVNKPLLASSASHQRTLPAGAAKSKA